MKITVDLPESDLQQICGLTGITKKGPAIRKLLSDSLLLIRRTHTTRKFLTGEWSVGLDRFEAARQQDRLSARTLGELWRD